MRMMRPSGRIGMTTTEPGWVMTSRVARTPVGSSTSSRRTPKTGPLYSTLLRRILPADLLALRCAGLLDFFGGMGRGVSPAGILAGVEGTSPSRVARQLPATAAVPILVIRSMSINTIIVDDEKPARDELAFLLKGFPEINVIGQGKNGVEAMTLIKEHAPDLVFLDVQMPGLDGFGVLRKLVERKMKVPHVVFATAFDHYAVEAFKVNAVDYVLKPFDKARIAKAIQRARKVMETQTSTAERLEQLVSQLNGNTKQSVQPAKILVKSGQRLLLVAAEDLIFASIDDGLISVCGRDVEGTSNYRTLEELHAALDSETFWRPHRSYLVNIHHIKEVVPWFKSSYMLKMDDKKQSEVPVSRVQTKRLRELFKL